MKKIMIATAALALMSGSAFAQNTGPAPQSDNMQKPGMHSTEKGSMHKGTTGMNTGTKGMAKGGMQPDASGQGGSGPGSDQGGTKAGTMK
ncbi:hypothetical protein WHZ77_26990 [Bradyrhizobium sp. A5]|uniref:hypothetical protein n=1 Tax=Bradyrhizobium sp. A5 TaxID=3133696 RepID=UPI0032516B9E